jgi:hypothetical protein
MNYARSIMWFIALGCIAGAIGINAYIDTCSMLVGIRSGLIAFGLECIFSVVANYTYYKIS